MRINEEDVDLTNENFLNRHLLFGIKITKILW